MYVQIQNFKYGLDTRKSELTSLPGTLVTLDNAHINQGGEVEKRKAFVRTAMTTNCRGLESTSAGLITFGSDADPGGWPRGAVTAYQRLQHPAVQVFGASYDATKHAMTSVVWSRSYKGLAFVCAKFADGFSFLYYNGTAIPASYSGLSLSGFSTQDARNKYQREDLTNQLNAITGWVAVSLGAVASQRLIGNDLTSVWTTLVDSPASVTYTYVFTETSATGEHGYYSYGSQTADAGTAGTATFTVNGGGGTTYNFYAPFAYNGTIWFPLFNVGVGWAVSNNNTAGLIRDAINANTATTGFTATALGAVVTVINPILASNLPAAAGGYTWNPMRVICTGGDTSATRNFSASSYSTTASGQEAEIGFGMAWSTGDNWSFAVTSTAGDFTLGRGNLGNGWWASGTVVSPASGYVFSDRAYVANGTIFNFSAVGDITGWEEQNVGAGFLNFTSQYGAADTVKAFSAYQGKLAVLGRRSVQIWVTNADPNNFALSQVLTNIGMYDTDSAQSLGDLDVIFLYDTGVRSLRVRDASSNATVTDIGAPIDSLIVAKLLSYTASCGIVEPGQNRYWLFLNDTIYVLSYFPLNQIIAWSTYQPTYDATGTQTAFVPSKFTVHNGQVYAREEHASNGGAVYAYGGSNNSTYDGAVATVQTPWLDAKEPGTWKGAKGVDVEWSGAWSL